MLCPKEVIHRVPDLERDRALCLVVDLDLVQREAFTNECIPDVASIVLVMEIIHGGRCLRMWGIIRIWVVNRP